ncbi:MAG TPA: hypothetical protein VMJ70_14100 [Candidatus Sulfotelmatobacter sp.]|nr:hypothetical protein [Candidatus Sulfotelmatobacter sp.]
MIAAKRVARALICSGAGSLTALVALQAGAWLGGGGEVANPAAVSASTSPVERGVAIGRTGLVMFPLLWALALLWGGLVTWPLRRLRSQTLALYVGVGVLLGLALGALGIGSMRLIGASPLATPRAAVVMIAFASGGMVGFAAYWRWRRSERTG